jgi:hypothetical protein
VLSHNKADFKPKLVRRDRAGHYVLMKETVYKEDVLIVNIYPPNVGKPNFIK